MKTILFCLALLSAAETVEASPRITGLPVAAPVTYSDTICVIRRDNAFAWSLLYIQPCSVPELTKVSLGMRGEPTEVLARKQNYVDQRQCLDGGVDNNAHPN